MSKPAYEITVRAAQYLDGSGYAGEATVSPGDDGEPAVEASVIYKLTLPQWIEFRAAIDDAFKCASKR